MIVHRARVKKKISDLDFDRHERDEEASNQISTSWQTTFDAIKDSIVLVSMDGN